MPGGRAAVKIRPNLTKDRKWNTRKKIKLKRNSSSHPLGDDFHLQYENSLPLMFPLTLIASF